MTFFNSVKQNVHKVYMNTVSSLTPTLTTSKFLEEGVLTPEEFVFAGDLLVYKCPTWTWEAGDPQRAVTYLPKDKQFLVTRNVPCAQRAHTLQDTVNQEKTCEVVVDGEGGWIATQMGSDKVGKSEDDEIPEISTTPINSKTQNEDDDDDDDSKIPNLEDFQEENVLVEDDPAALPKKNDESDNILRTRTYDIFITYDKYYQTPKVWLFGYDENRQPLKPEEVFLDISQDHALKTVTIDTMPHLGIASAFIHPCRHAPVMKKILHRLAENGKELRVDQYLFLFLKFISAVIPTIEYDYTIAMEG